MRTPILTILWLSACQAAPDPGTEPRSAAPAGTADTLVVAWADDVESLISVVPQTSADGEVTWLINPMIADVGFDCGLSFHPFAAESWSFSEDGLSLEVVLREGLRWSDGQPVTSRDVAFTYALAADPAVASPRAAFVAHMDPAAAPRVIDDRTLQFVFERAYDPSTMLAHAFGLELLPEHALRDADRGTLKGHAFNRDPVVYGPWRVAAHEPGQTLTLEPNPAFTGPEDWKPRLRRVILKVLPEPATRELELKAGSVDMVTGLEPEAALALKEARPDLTLHRRGWRAMEYVGWNTIDGERYAALLEAAGDSARPDPSQAGPHPILGDARVRTALTQAFDIPRAMERLLGADEALYGIQAVGTISPALCQHHASDLSPLPFDPDAARGALAEAGWRDSDGDGLLDKDGRPFSLELLVSAGNPRRERIALLLQDALRELGVELNISTLDFNAYVQRAVTKDFDALVGGWSADLFVDPSTQWRSGPEQVYNFVSYANPEVDALIERGLAEPDPGAASAIWRDLQATIYRDQPYTFLWWVDEIVAVDGRFQGVAVHPSSPFYHLHEWWVPADKVKYER
jgi:peptide/nickel transport system substrate-binding protein